MDANGERRTAQQRRRARMLDRTRPEPVGPWRIAVWDGKTRWVRPVRPFWQSRYWFAFKPERYSIRAVDILVGPDLTADNGGSGQ